MLRLVLATRNAHKLEEVRRILAGQPVELLALERFPQLGELEETGDTFEENALQKARQVARATGLPVVADDSGLEVDALGGLPGVHSRRFTAEATDAANNAELLRRLAAVPDEARTARFVCALALVHGDREAVVRATVEGRIGHAPRGRGGFGYDPLFLPDEAPGRSMAELSPAEKNAISHRGRAFRRLPELVARVGLVGPAP